MNKRFDSWEEAEAWLRSEVENGSDWPWWFRAKQYWYWFVLCRAYAQVDEGSRDYCDLRPFHRGPHLFQRRWPDTWPSLKGFG